MDLRVKGVCLQMKEGGKMLAVIQFGCSGRIRESKKNVKELRDYESKEQIDKRVNRMGFRSGFRI